MEALAVTSVPAVEEQLGLMVRSFKQFWIRAAADLHPQLQPLGYGVLVLLTKGGPQPMASVADRMNVDKAVLSRQVRQLIDLGLVEIEPDPQDGRARILQVPAEVEAAVAAQRRRSASPVGTELATWSDEDLSTFSALMARLLSAADRTG